MCFTPVSESVQQETIEQLTSIINQQGNKMNKIEEENKLLMEKIDELQTKRDSSMANTGMGIPSDSQLVNTCTTCSEKHVH